MWFFQPPADHFPGHHGYSRSTAGLRSSLQVLALVGARPVPDSLGRVNKAAARVGDGRLKLFSQESHGKINHHFLMERHIF